MDEPAKKLPLSHRPGRSGSNTRQKQESIRVRVTPEERAEFDAAAQAAGLTVSSHIRQSHLKLVRQTRSRLRPLVDVVALAPAFRTMSGAANNLNQLAKAANEGRYPAPPLLEKTLAEALRIMEELRRLMGIEP